MGAAQPDKSTDDNDNKEISPINMYFHDVAANARFSAKDESEIAGRFWDSRCSLWSLLLAERGSRQATVEIALTRFKLDKIPETLEPGLRALARSRETMEAADVAELAHACATSDRDLCAVTAAVAHVQEVANERELALAAYRGLERVRATRNAFVAANLGLVISVARRYNKGRLGFLDLIQEGNTGLLKAVDRFDTARGVRFSTYAVWWIRQAIGRALSDKSREIRLPVHVTEQQIHVIRARNALEQKNGRTPTMAEIAEATGYTPAKVEELLVVDFERATSLDRSGSDTSSQPLDVESLPGELDLPDLKLDAETMGSNLREALDKLPEVELDVVRRRFGLDGFEPMTLREVGDVYSLSRERIRQLQDRALGLLRRELKRNGIKAA